MSTSNTAKATELLTTFRIGHDFFGIEVMKVQEVTGTPIIIPVPLAPKFILGLINLRGQLATALGLRELFNKKNSELKDQMSVVCRIDNNLVSLMVDSIGEVVEVDRNSFEPPTDTLPQGVKQFVKGIYKMNSELITVLDLEKIAKELTPTVEAS
jgi:purine-binding chemotaxis protein CheW